jgi:PBP1b-binding outer membrane lipoprotein LpoB
MIVMKNIISLFICALLISSCSSIHYNKIHSKYRDVLEAYYGYVDLNAQAKQQDVIVFVDFLPIQKSPKVITDYYSSLNDNDINGVIIKSKIENESTLFVAISRKAKEGYFKLNKETYGFIMRHNNIKYLINNDTITTIDDMKRLVTLKQTQIHSIDTIVNPNNSLIVIKTE